MNGFIKATKLEFNDMKNRWLSLVFFMFVPAIVISLYYYSSTATMDYGEYKNLMTYYDFLASQVFSMVIVFISTQLMVLRIVGERSPHGTLDRDLIAISRFGMYAGKFFANMVFVALQVLLVYFFGFVLFPAKNYGGFFPLILILFLVALFGLVTGLLISVFVKNNEQAIQLVPFVILISMLLSGIFIPLDTLPTGLDIIARNMPLTLGIESMKMTTLNALGLEDVYPYIAKLLIWVLCIFVLGLLKFEVEKRK